MGAEQDLDRLDLNCDGEAARRDEVVRRDSSGRIDLKSGGTEKVEGLVQVDTS